MDGYAGRYGDALYQLLVRVVPWLTLALALHELYLLGDKIWGGVALSQIPLDCWFSPVLLLASALLLVAKRKAAPLLLIAYLVTRLLPAAVMDNAATPPWLILHCSGAALALLLALLHYNRNALR